MRDARFRRARVRRMHAGLFVVLCAGFALVGCSENSLHWWEASHVDGRLFVLDKLGGDVYVLEGNELQLVARTETVWPGPSMPDDVETFARQESFERDRWLFDDIVKVSVVTKYRDGEVQVRGAIEPAISQLQSGFRSARVLSLRFVDVEQFEVVSVDVLSDDLTKVVDESGKPMELVFSKRAAVSPASWTEAVLLEVTWTSRTESLVEEWVRKNPKDSASRRLAAQQERAEHERRITELLEQAGLAGEAGDEDEGPEDGPVESGVGDSPFRSR